MAETIILDPNEVATGRTELDITAYVKAEGADWGDAEISAYMADMKRGSSPVDYRVPNRQIVLPLNVKPTTGRTFAVARQLLQRKVSRIQQEGGWVRRTTTSGTLFADVVNASLKLGGDWMQANRGFDVNAELHLECIPDWYGNEIQLGDHLEITNPELVWTETNILGDYPGRLRLVVDDDQGQNQQGLIWGVRSRHYSASTTAQLRYFPSTCTPLDAAVVSGQGVFHPNVSTAWTPVFNTDQTGGVALTHTGTYRVWVRASCSGVVAGTTVPTRLRLLWDVGDFALPTENSPVQLPGFNQTFAVDLGEVRLDRVPAGGHRWRGVVQAATQVGGENLVVDRFWMVPVDEGYGVLRAPLNVDAGLNPFLVRDEFNQSGGVLTGKTLAVGGAWTGAGDTDDFVVDATGHTASRSAVGDADNDTGRYAIAGTNNYTNVVVQGDVLLRTSATGPVIYQGVIARYVDVNNWLMAHLSTSGQQSRVLVRKNVGGASTVLADVPVARPYLVWRTIRLWVSSAGQWSVWWAPQGGAPARIATGFDNVFVTGQQLATGRVGLYDNFVGAAPPSGVGGTGQVSLVRGYDNFAAWAPQQDAVLFSLGTAELRTEGMFREDPNGVAYGPVTHVVGDLPRIPASGAENRPVQFFVKVSRGDLETLPDVTTDDLSARVTYRPSYLLTS